MNKIPKYSGRMCAFFYQQVLIICFITYVFGYGLHAKESSLVMKVELFARDDSSIPATSRGYRGIAYSDSGNQLMLWDEDANIRIYDIINGKLTLKMKGSYAVDKNSFWQPNGICFNESEKKCMWFPSLSFYDSLIQSTYDPPHTFKQLKSFLNKCRHMNQYASTIVKRYCKRLEYNDYSGVGALAYDDHQRLTPIINDYNNPLRKGIQGIISSLKLLGESLDMNVLAYYCERGDSSERSPKIVFLRRLKEWRMVSLRDLYPIDNENQIASFSLSPQGNLACFVLYRFPSYGRHIGSKDWFKSFFQRQRKHVVIVVLDIQKGNVLLKEKISGFIGVEKQLLWRAAFCESKREFVLLNGLTGSIKMYRY